MAARLLGLEAEVGTIGTGKRANLIIVCGEPGDVRGLAHRVHAVYKDGVRVPAIAAA